MSQLNDYIAIITAEIYLEDENETIKENTILTNVKSYASAAELLEEYYGNSLLGFEITLFDGPFLHVSNNTLEKIVTEEVL